MNPTNPPDITRRYLAVRRQNPPGPDLTPTKSDRI